MPNHITNRLTISGPHTIDTSKPIAFEDFVPTPEGYISGECSHDHPYPHSAHDPHRLCWYVWNIANWGTKWRAYDTEGWVGDTTTFDTAWSPPHPVIEALARQNPHATITHEYIDEGMNSYGARQYRQGCCVRALDEVFCDTGAYCRAWAAWRLRLNGETTYSLENEAGETRYDVIVNPEWLTGSPFEPLGDVTLINPRPAYDEEGL